MGMPDVIYECHESETSYRIRPNPDAEPGSGYRNGAVLEWSDDGKEWGGAFFLAPDAIPAIATALAKVTDDLGAG